jgi:hypothetical protein
MLAGVGDQSGFPKWSEMLSELAEELGRLRSTAVLDCYDCLTSVHRKELRQQPPATPSDGTKNKNKAPKNAIHVCFMFTACPRTRPSPSMYILVLDIISADALDPQLCAVP